MRGPHAVMVAAVVALLLPVQGQQASGSPLSPAANVLHAHVGEEGAPYMDTSPTGWDADAPAHGPVGTGLLVNGTYTWALPLRPALASSVHLDRLVDMTINAFLGSARGGGALSVSTRLAMGSTIVAEGSPKSLTLTPSGTPTRPSFTQLFWAVKPAVATLAPGPDLVWTVTVAGTATDVSLGASDANGRSHLELPVVGVSDILTRAGPSLNATLVYANLTDRVTQVDWVTSLHEATWLAFTDAQEVSSASIAVLDGNGTYLAGYTVGEGVLHRQGVAANLTREPGSWRVFLNVTGFHRSSLKRFWGGPELGVRPVDVR